MQPTPDLLELAKNFDHVLFESDVMDRFAHHAAHVAMEGWLTIELAYLVNRRAAHTNEAGAWMALPERGRTDLRLTRAIKGSQGLGKPEQLHLELKLVDTGTWEQNWKSVQEDLAGKLGKPPATYSVCLVIHACSEGERPRRPDTVRLHERYFSRVPTEPATFEPVLGKPTLFAVACLPDHTVRWPHAVPGKWPRGYEARMRFVWVTQPITALQPAVGGGPVADSSPGSPTAAERKH